MGGREEGSFKPRLAFCSDFVPQLWITESLNSTLLPQALNPDTYVQVGPAWEPDY